jgi:putative DNA primase/helicase
MTTIVRPADISALVNGHFHTPEDAQDEFRRKTAEDALLKQGPHDEGNAQCINLRYNGKFLHSESFGWMQYTDTHWTLSEAESAVERAATETLQARITHALMSGDMDKYGDIIRKSVPNSSRVQGAKAQLRSLVSISHDCFDTQLDWLNCQNGIVDLRTGNLHPHQPTQRFMHCTTVGYAPDADQTLWVNWLIDVVGSSEIAEWLQLAVGYSLTGHTREEILFYLFGPPRSGKGTFTETLMALLGTPLAKEVNFASFTSQRTGDSQNFDLAPLKPCRFVAASESNTYERFNEAKVKALTGGNDIYCAYKHRDHFNYRPQFKIWLSSNQPVNADPDDDAVWGRLRVIEFPHSHLGDEDKFLKESMRTPLILEGVLAWAIEGAMCWYALGRDGLPELATSVSAKTQQRSELDNVQAWIEECCTQSEQSFTSSSGLFSSYADWCKNNGVTPKQQKALSQSLKRKGFPDKVVKQNGKATRGFNGLTIS